MGSLTKEQVQKNKEVFLALLDSIQRENSNIDGLKDLLCKSDFFIAPASTRFHCGYEGGLCEHSLNVYFNLVLLNSLKKTNLSEDCMKIIALCHDLGKIGYYESYVQNKKVYTPEGTQKDSKGKFEWVSQVNYKKKEESFLTLGSHGEISEYITRCYIPLNTSETAAILNHHAGFDAAPSTNITGIYNKYPEAILLHIADMLSCYSDERI